MSTMSKFAPKAQVLDPRRTTKKNGLFWNWPVFLYFGGVNQKHNQDGSKGPKFRPEASQNAVGPISDRGKGRG